MKRVPLLVLLTAGCASVQPVAWTDVGKSIDGRTVSLRGTIESSPAAGTLHLCPLGRSDLAQCIDVVASPRTIANLRSGNCSSLSGRFVAFGPDVVGIGNFRSSIGYIEAADARACDER